MDDSVEDISAVHDDAEIMNATVERERHPTPRSARAIDPIAVSAKSLVVQRSTATFVSRHGQTIRKGW